MLETKIKLEYNLCENKSSGIPVIVVAAGSSSRMNGVNKQMLLLGGIPVLVRTLLQFERNQNISRIIVVSKKENLLEIQKLADEYMISKLTDIVEGGASRQESVLNGLNRLSQNEEKVLIHDGARPLVSQKTISDVANALENYVAVTCAVKVKDTIKEIDKEKKVIKTLNRENLVSVQTPQGARVLEYLKAIRETDISKFTDDTSILEEAGYDVYTVEGSYKNIKITTVEDIKVAQGFLSEEAEECE